MLCLSESPHLSLKCCCLLVVGVNLSLELDTRHCHWTDRQNWLSHNSNRQRKVFFLHQSYFVNRVRLLQHSTRLKLYQLSKKLLVMVTIKEIFTLKHLNIEHSWKSFAWLTEWRMRRYKHPAWPRALLVCFLLMQKPQAKYTTEGII